MHDQLKTNMSLILSFDLLHLVSFIQCAHYLSSHWLILEITTPTNYFSALARLITLTCNLIVPDILKTSSNDCLYF